MDNQIKVLGLDAINASDSQALLPTFSKVNTIVFFKKTRKLWGIVVNKYSDRKIIKLCARIAPSKEILDKTLSLVGSYFWYSNDEGVLISTPLIIFRIWRVTFKGCLRMSGGNQIVSCPMAIVVTTISLFPSYEHHN